MNSTLRYVFLVTAKNGLNAILVTLPPVIHFHHLNRAGLEHILWLMGSAVVAREGTVWLPKLLEWSTTPPTLPPGTMNKLASVLLLLLLLFSPIAARAQQPQNLLLTTNLNLTNQSGGQFPVTKVAPVPLSEWGWLFVTWSGITGSPTNCNFVLQFSGTLATTPSFQSNSGTVAPANGNSNSMLRVKPTGTNVSGYGSQVSITAWNCSGFPTAGTATIEFMGDAVGLATTDFTYQHITSNANFAIGSFIHTLVIGNAGTSETISIFDNGGTCSGAVLAVITPVAGQTYTFDANASSFSGSISPGGFCVLPAGTTAGDYTVTYR